MSSQDYTANKDAKAKLEGSMNFLKAGKYESATNLVDEALELKPDYIEAWLFKGVILGKLGRCSEAIKCHDKAIELDPNCGEAWLVKGAVLTSLSKHDEAIPCYDRVLELTPENTEANSYKGYSLEKLQRLDDAIQCYAKVLLQKPDDAKVWYTLAILHGKKCDYETSLRHFERALEIRENFDEAIAGKSIMLVKLGRKDEANQFLQYMSQKKQL